MDFVKVKEKLEFMRTGMWGEYFTHMGLAVPTDTVTTTARMSRVVERGEQFASGAFREFDMQSAPVCLGHKGVVVAKDDRVCLCETYAGLMVFFRATGAAASALLASGDAGLSIAYWRDYTKRSVSRDGVRTIRLLEAGGLREIAVTPEGKTAAYGDTWLMAISKTSNERLCRENVEALERRHGNAFIPGISSLVASSTRYRFTLKTRRTA